MINKRGISPVIVTILLIALVLVIIGIVWTVVNNLVKDQIEGVESCTGVIGEVSLNSIYTCFESGTTPNVTFSVTRSNIDVDEIIVSIFGEGGTIKSFILNSTSQILTGELVNYALIRSDRTTGTALPIKNEGKTYVYIGGGFSNVPDRVELSVTINGNSCGVIDTMEEVSSC